MSTAVTGFHTFTYKHGDRPLDGYTIQRAAGRGGFGEVYYALSDSGREVALKAVLGYEQIELRGISQCMNLKSPHLVTVFDVKHNDQGRPFVIMEYVAGPSLRQLLDESPGGLGTQKAAFFLREMAKGLTFLHECGIVHRDLKPANIFYENGYVKIGDYGLSKAMEPGPHSAQTITVGTVHYMAPEIGAGRYDKGIDIYALGAVLYEMLTGQVPYLGASAGEILMKHMTAEPDVTGIEEPFASVIKKAMHRDPAKRYQNVQEMVEAIFGAEHVRNSVSCFSPEDLSMVAQRVARQVAAANAARATGGSSGPAPKATGLDGPPPSDVWDRMGGWVDRAGDRFGAVGGRLADAGARMIPHRMRRGGAESSDKAGTRRADEDLGPQEIGDPLCDPLSKRQRRVIGLIVVAVVALVTGMFDPFGDNSQIPAAMVTFTAAYGAAAGMLLARRRLLPQMAAEQPFIRRVVPAAVAGTGAFLTSIWVAGPAPGRVQEIIGMSFLAFVVPLFLNWKADTSPSRPERVTFGANLGSLIVGFILAHIFDGSPALVVGTLAATGLLTQILSPWDPFAARRKKESKRQTNQQWGGRGAPQYQPQPQGGAAAVVPPPPPSPVMPVATATPARVPPPPRLFQPVPAEPAAGRAPARPVPVWARWAWLLALVLSIPGGIMSLVYAGTEARRADEFALSVGFGVGLLVLGVLSFVKALQMNHRGWWRYAGRWLGLWACFQVAFISVMFLGAGDLRNGEILPAVFFTVFPLVLAPVIAFVRFSPAGSKRAASTMAQSMNGMSQTMSSMAGAPSASGYRRRPAAAIIFPAIGRLVWAAGDLALALVIAGLLGVAALIGLSLAIDIPGMIAAGLPDPHLATQLNREFGFESWPGLLRHIGILISVVTLLLAVGLLMLSRRRWGGTHMLRAIIAIGVFLLALTNLSHSLHGTWTPVPDRAGRPSMPASVERYLNSAEPAGLATAGMMALVSFTLIAWPADKRRNRQKAVAASEAGEPRPAAAPAPAAEAKPV